MKLGFRFLIITATLLFVPRIQVSAQDKGEATFTQICAACHSIGKGRLVGPDLANVDQRRPQEWILKFVKSSQSVIKSGDKYADSLFQAFNKTIMPDQPTLNDENIKDVIAFIRNKGTAALITAPVSVTAQPSQSTGDNAGILSSTTDIVLFVFILFMLIVIIFLARIIKNLSDEIRDIYSSDRSFF